MELIKYIQSDEDEKYNAALVQNQTAVVQILLKFSNIDINLQDHKGRTSLRIVCFNGNLEIVKILVKKDFNQTCDINKACSESFTPLAAACRGGHSNVALYLLTCNESVFIDVNKEDNYQNIALH